MLQREMPEDMAAQTPTCPSCSSGNLLFGRCRECGHILSGKAASFEELDELAALRSIAKSADAMRRMLGFFVILTVVSLAVGAWVVFSGT